MAIDASVRSKRRNRTKVRRAALSNVECETAVELLQEMQDCGVRPTVFTYNLLIAALARSRYVGPPSETRLAALYVGLGLDINTLVPSSGMFECEWWPLIQTY